MQRLLVIVLSKHDIDLQKLFVYRYFPCHSFCSGHAMVRLWCRVVLNCQIRLHFREISAWYLLLDVDDCLLYMKTLV